MNQQRIAYYVLCRDQARVDQWQSRAVQIPDIEFHFWTGFLSMYAFIQNAIEHCQSTYVVIAHDDVIIGRDFARRVHSLVAELEASFPNWGVVGNAGVDVEGRVKVFSKDPWCEPQWSQSPEIVACVDGNLMLVNRQRFLEAGCEYPDLGGFHGYDVVLSLECLRNGLMVLADGRLRVVHLSGGDGQACKSFIRSDPFQNYFRKRFSDSRIPLLMGFQPILEWPNEGVAVRPSLRSLQDAALAKSLGGKNRTLAIIACDPEVAVGLPKEFPPEVAMLLDIEVIPVCVGGHPNPEKGQDFLHVPASGIGFIVQEAFRSLTHGHFWFVTESLELEPSALPFVARTLAGNPNSLVVGTYCVRVGEGRSSGGQNGAVLMRSIFGAGHFPLSALFIPAHPLREVVLQCSWSQLDVDGALLGALALRTPGVRFVSTSARILAADGPSVAIRQAPEAYGDDDDWEYVERLGCFVDIASSGNLSLWGLAKGAVLAEPPSAWMRWALDLEHFVTAVGKVIKRPRKYLKRGFSLAFHYLIRLDIRGLIREARLFHVR